MNYLKKFESNNKLDKDNIVNYFLHSIDLCESYDIDIIYFDNRPGLERQWANNDFGNSVVHPSECIEGVSIEFKHSNFAGITEIRDLSSYIRFLVQLDEDVERFKSIENPSEIFFEELGNINTILVIKI